MMRILGKYFFKRKELIILLVLFMVLMIMEETTLLFVRACFFILLLLGIYAKSYVRTMYMQEKIFYGILVSLSILFVHLLLHTRLCDHSTHVDV